MNDLKIILKFTKGHFEGREVEMTKKAIILGRSTSATLRLTDPQISGEHALLSYNETHWAIKDLNSANGTFLNGVKITEEQELKSGDSVSICTESFEFLKGTEATVIQEATIPVEDEQDVKKASYGGFALTLILLIALAAFLLNEPLVESKAINNAVPVLVERNSASDDGLKPVAPIATSEVLNPRIESSPKGASIELDGVLIGKTPYQIVDLIPGIYTVSLIKKSYLPIRETLEIKSDEPLVFELEKHPSTSIYKTNPIGVELYSGGQFIGETPLLVYKEQELDSDLLLKATGYADYLALQGELENNLELDKSHAALYVSSKLGALKLRQNDQYFGELNAGETRLFHGLKAGDLSLEARNQSGDLVTKAIKLEAGKNSSVEFSLFAITHKLSLSKGEELFGMLIKEADQKMLFATSVSEIKEYKVSEVKQVSKASYGDQYGVRKGLEVTKKRIRTLNPNIWAPIKVDAAEEALESRELIHVSANELSSAYKTMDLFEFQSTYGRKAVLISGTITDIRMGDEWYTLNLDNFVECYFRRDGQSVEQMQKRFGQNVKVNGYAMGIRGLDLYVMTECEE